MTASPVLMDIDPLDEEVDSPLNIASLPVLPWDLCEVNDTLPDESPNEALPPLESETSPPSVEVDVPDVSSMSPPL